MNVVGYLRVSTAAQKDKGYSLDAQKHAIGQDVDRRGWRLAEMASDTGSGKSLKRRPGLARALERLDAGEFDGLMVARLDRLSRSVGDFGTLMDRSHKHGWTIVCLDPAVDLSTPFGRAFAGMGAVIAQLERELIAQRTREGIAAYRAAGNGWGPPRLIDPETERIIVRERRRGKSLRTIARMLDAEGVPTAAGGRWHPATVARVVERN